MRLRVYPQATFFGSVFGLFVFLPKPAALQGFPQADGPFLDFLSVLGKSGLRSFPLDCPSRKVP